MDAISSPYRSPSARRLAAAAVAAAMAIPLLMSSSQASTTAPSAPDWRTVLVTGAGGAEAAAAAVRALGGKVVDELPLVFGVAARLPRSAQLPAGWVETPQRAMRVTASAYDGTSPGDTVRATVGLPATGSEGSGVNVAVVDTGVADVGDLAGRVDHVDLTGTGSGDGFGHGTFMAGILGGSGASSGGLFTGVAPGAHISDVKVARADGSTDLVTVLRGLQWVAAQGTAVQVLNLSLDSASALPYQLDPLTQALDALWRRGVVVVVPSGNTGPGPGSVSSPGSDPMLLTAGGLDEGATPARSDDTVASWSGRGPSWQGVSKPDLVAPGAHVIGLRSPGSVIDTANPSAQIGADYFIGSGTSMSAAVVSGAVADLLASSPGLKPDQVKALLLQTAYAAPGLPGPGVSGAGGLDVGAVLAMDKSGLPGSAGKIDTSQADAIAADAPAWMALSAAIGAGNNAAALLAWNALSTTSRTWASRTWSGLDLTSRTWASRTWASRTWSGGSADDWASRTWAAAMWTTMAWQSRTWSSRTWSSRTWSGDSWLSRTWASGDWSSRTWSASTWATAGWGDAS